MIFRASSRSTCFSYYTVFLNLTFSPFLINLLFIFMVLMKQTKGLIVNFKKANTPVLWPKRNDTTIWTWSQISHKTARTSQDLLYICWTSICLLLKRDVNFGIKIGSDWPETGHICEFLRSVSVHLAQRAKIYWNWS